MAGVFTGEDGKVRCGWCRGDALMQRYHDEEWGTPVADDVRLFEKLCLEGFQSGLSWRTILAKREAFRAAFCGFDWEKVAEFGEQDVLRLLADAGIVRHRGKIEAAINNARAMQRLVAEEGSFARYVARYRPDVAGLGAPQSLTTCPEAVALAKDLKKRGFRFVGPTTAFAFMQAMGLFNDHALGCYLGIRR